MIRPRDRSSSAGLLPRMEARPRKDGLITYRFLQHDGKWLRLGTDREAALRQVLDINARAKDQGTIGQMWRLYQDSAQWKRLAESTRRVYAEQWRVVEKVWSNAVVSAVRPADVAKYLRVERADAPVSANREVALLSNLFNLAVERGDIDRNPCKEVRRNREEPRGRLVERAELEAFADWALRQGDSAVVLVSMAEFAALAGNRRAEFLRLHWPQVDDELVRLQRAKQRGSRGKRELVAISDRLRVVLERMRSRPKFNPMGPVFAAPRTGNPYSEPGFKAMWARLMNKALAERVVLERFTFHDLRAHYTTYHKLEHGALPEMHADPGTTARVYDRAREVKRKAI